MGQRQWREAHADPAGQADTERVHRELRRKVRDECLNENWFASLEHARAVIGAWRRDYNEVRPHSAISDQTPAQFAATMRETGCLTVVDTRDDEFNNQDSAK